MIYREEIAEISHSLKNLALLIDAISSEPKDLSPELIDRLNQYQNIIMLQLNALDVVDASYSNHYLLKLLQQTEALSSFILDDAKELLFNIDSNTGNNSTHWC